MIISRAKICTFKILKNHILSIYLTKIVWTHFLNGSTYDFQLVYLINSFIQLVRTYFKIYFNLFRCLEHLFFAHRSLYSIKGDIGAKSDSSVWTKKNCIHYVVWNDTSDTLNPNKPECVIYCCIQRKYKRLNKPCNFCRMPFVAPISSLPYT